MIARIATAAAVAVALAAMPAVGEEFSAIYDIHIGGLRAGELSVDAHFDGNRYEARGGFRTSGLVGLFFDTTLDVVTRGRVEAGELTPLRFVWQERDGSDEQILRVSYTADGTAAVIAEPALKVKPWSIRPEQTLGALDPLSALLMVLIPGPPEKICDRRLEAFDGRYRFAFDLGPVRRHRDEVICEGHYLRLAGFKPKKMHSPNARIPFRLRLVRRSDGSWQVERVKADTEFGTAVVRLRP